MYRFYLVKKETVPDLNLGHGRLEVQKMKNTMQKLNIDMRYRSGISQKTTRLYHPASEISDINK